MCAARFLCQWPTFLMSETVRGRGALRAPAVGTVAILAQGTNWAVAETQAFCLAVRISAVHRGEAHQPILSSRAWLHVQAKVQRGRYVIGFPSGIIR